MGFIGEKENTALKLQATMFYLKTKAGWSEKQMIKTKVVKIRYTEFVQSTMQKNSRKGKIVLRRKHWGLAMYGDVITNFNFVGKYSEPANMQEKTGKT